MRSWLSDNFIFNFNNFIILYRRLLTKSLGRTPMAFMFTSVDFFVMPIDYSSCYCECQLTLSPFLISVRQSVSLDTW